MCEFKYCEGPHACFLRDISPCKNASRVFEPKVPANTDRPRRRGFVDRDALARALVEDRATASVQSAMAVERVSTKFLKAVEAINQREKASA
jgi:hypothetical protein